jgi:hypothetical protein
MSYVFCTYFDQNYLNRALALYTSLKRFCGPFRLFALCLDDDSHDLLVKLNLPEIHPVAISELERYDAPLCAAKPSRSRIEYYFTCTPSILLYVLNNHPECRSIAYLDSDLFFFSDPRPIYDEIGGHSIAIIPHRFSKRLKHREIYGIYNVGFLYFRNDPASRECLEWWRQKCIEWCYDQLDGERFADQKYLDRWPELFRSVKVISQYGANLAPWNLDRSVIRREQGRIMVADDPLVFFHFHGLKQINSFVYDLHLENYRLQSSRLVRSEIFKPYVAILHRISCKLDSLMRQTNRFWDQRYSLKSRPAGERLYRLGDRYLRYSLMALRRNFMIVHGNKVY